MEIEINFRFDENGRTANTRNNHGHGGDALEETNTTAIDYGFKAAMTNLAEISDSESMDELLFDCEISDNVIMPRTYWMPADGTTQPRCSLEQLALDIFHHHVPPDGLDYDRETSGAEWWCQLRPSPVMGRHTVVCASSSGDDNDDEDDPFDNGISFHVDKDEELRILTGGSTYVHPHISTITYLTNLGSPTLIMDCQVHPLTGEWIVPDASVEGFVSWPSVGKHTSFDGRYLHAAPPDLMGSKDAFRKQLESVAAKNNDDDNGKSKARKRRHRRVTFLVNIWLNYRPYDVNPFPEAMIDKMSGGDSKTRRHLKFPEQSATATSTGSHVATTLISSNRATETVPETEKGSPSERVYTTERFTWPLGDKHSKEELRCEIPMKSITEASTKGENVRIQWQKKQNGSTANENNGIDDDCFHLYSGKSCPAAATTAPTTETENEEIPVDAAAAKRSRVE